jgi:hypothetical protein
MKDKPNRNSELFMNEVKKLETEQSKLMENQGYLYCQNESM